MAERVLRKPAHSKKRDDKDAQSSSTSKDIPSSRTTEGASTHRPGSADSHSHSSHNVTVVTSKSRTSDLRALFERNDSKSPGGEVETRRQRTNPVNVEVIPEPRLINVGSNGPGTKQPPASSSSSNRDKRFTVQSKISVKSSYDPAMRLKSNPGDTRVTTSPPLSPPPDENTVRHKPPLSGASYAILPDQTNPLGAARTSAAKGLTQSTTTGSTETSVTKGLITTNAEGLSSSSKVRVPIRFSSSHGGGGPQSLPSPTTSSGDLSSNEILSSGDRLSSEHTIAQVNSMDGKARVVGGTSYGHSSFGIDPHDYTPTKEQHEPSSELSTTAATGTGSPQSNVATTSHSTSHLSQASVRVPTDDDTLVGGEEGTCHDKLLLTKTSIGMSHTGRPILNASMSEGSVVGVQHQIQQQARISELESRISELQRQLNAQNEHPQDGRSLEQVYTHRQHMDYLTNEVKRLAPLENEVERLRKEEKRLEGLYQEAKTCEEQIVELVSTVSKKEAEILELKKQLELSSGDHLKSDESEGDVNIHAEVARLKEQVKNKDHEVSRLRALLRVHEKSKTVETSKEGSTGFAAVQAEYERKLAHKETMISRLKKKVMELAEATHQPVLDEDEAGSTDDKMLTETDSRYGKCRSSSELGAGGVASEHRLGGIEDSQKELVEELQRAIEEKDKQIEKMSSQLQTLTQTATNLTKMMKHSKGQSGEILRLKKELEAAVAEKAEIAQGSKSIESTEEMEAMRLKVTESLSTIRRLRIQMQILEEEKKKLTGTAHEYANTKLDDVERENASLKEKATANQQLIATMSVKINGLSQQKAAIEEKLQSVVSTKDMLEQKVIGQQATIQNVIQDLQATKERASETAVTLERYKLQKHDLQKQCQELMSEKEALKAMAEVYQEDFNNERKDRESAHAQKTALEEHYKAEMAKFKEQLQRVGADNGRLTKSMREKEAQMQAERVALQRQLEEKHQYAEALKADKNTLQGEIQSKTQQVKQYKKQVDQFRGELDHCRADMEAYKQQAEQHKNQIEVVVNRCDHAIQTAKVLEEENKRLQKEVYTLQAREHLKKHAHTQQGGRDSSPINIDEFMKERRKAQDMERLANELRQKLDEVTFQKVIVESKLEDLKKHVHVSSRSSSSSRSPPPTVGTAAGATTRPPPYPGHRSQGGSALPNPVRPQHQFPPQNHRLNQQMKSVSVDSADGLSSRGHIDSAQFQAPIPSVRVASSNPQPPPTTTRSEAPHRDPRYQQGPQTRPKSHTSNILSPQRDLAVSHPFQAANCVGNAQSAAHRGGHQVLYNSSAGHSGDNMLPTNAGMGGWNGQYSTMSSPPTNAKYNSPFTTSNVVMPSQQSSGNYPQTFPHRVGGSAGNVQQQPPQPHGAQLAPGLSQANTFASNAPGPNVAQSMAGSRVPPFTGHGPSAPVGQAQTAVSSDAAQRQLYQNLPLDHQFHDQHNLSPPPDDGQGSGHMSLPSFGSGGFQQPQAQSPVHNHQQANHPYPHQVPKDDMYLLQQQKSAHGGYHHRHHHPAGDGGAHGYHAAVDVVEKDSSPPSSLVPQGHSQQGKHLSLNPQGLSPAIQPHHQHRSHQHPLSPEHQNNMGIAGGANKPRRVKADSSRPVVGGGSGHAGMRQGSRNDPVQLAPHYGHSAQVLGQLQQAQQHQGHSMTGGAVVNQQQRAHSHNEKGPIMESGLGSTKLPSSMQKQHGSGGNVYVALQERRNEDSRSPYMKEHRPEPDSDSVSNVSMESGFTSPTGDGSENTLEKGIDGDIRRAARNVKKQMAGRELSVGGGGVEAPYDPNLTCPSCGLRFRIGEIQKFKRHASTCTGT